MPEPASVSEAAIRWVASRFCQRTTQEDAPSGDAWSLLEWVRRQRSNEQTFFAVMFPRTLPTIPPPAVRTIDQEAQEDVSEASLKRAAQSIQESANRAIRTAKERDARFWGEVRDEEIQRQLAR